MEAGRTPHPHHPMAERLAWLAVQPIDELTLEACRDRLGELGSVVYFIQGLESRYAAQLARVSPNPESDHTDATRGSPRDSRDAHRRGQGREQSGPAGESLGEGMDRGQVSGAHLDAFLAVRATLPTDIRERFSRDTEPITGWATTLSVETFRRRLRRLAADLMRDYGINRLEQQKRETHLRTWIDQNGMVRLSGAFDPENAVGLSSALTAMLETLRAEKPSPHCPDDPVAKQDFLRAHALLRLIQHGPTCSGRGRAELVIIADTTRTNDRGEPTLDWGLPVDLPMESLARFYASIDRTTIVDVLRNGTIRDIGDQLDLGRSTRLANRAQRRVLRALHPTCVVPGCEVHFDRCDIHHITWWRHGGTTDLANLAPICLRHHDCVHRVGWVLNLDEKRRASVTLADLSVHVEPEPPPQFHPSRSLIPSLSP